MAHMMTRMTRWLDSHESLARWLAVCQDPPVRYWCSALTSFQASELVIKLVHNIPRKDYCDDFLCIYFFILELKYMKFIYLSFQENNNKYYTRSKNTCVTESTKKTTTQPR